MSQDEFEKALMAAAKDLLDPVWSSSKKARDIVTLYVTAIAERDEWKQRAEVAWHTAQEQRDEAVAQARAERDKATSERDQARKDFETVQEMQKYSTPADPTGVRNGLRFKAIEAERDAAIEHYAMLNDEIAPLRAERDAARAALAPFAAFADAWDRKPLRGVDDNNLYSIHTGTEWYATLSVTDCRRAKAALTAHAPATPIPPSRHHVVDEYEYRTTTGPRKGWDGLPDLALEGWEEWQEWERFDYHEERYWRRHAPEPEGKP